MHEDSSGFLALDRELDRDAYITLVYRFECMGDPWAAAAHLCQEQSTAQWKRVGVDEDLRGIYGSKVTSLDVLAKLEAPSLPGMLHQLDGPLYAAMVRIAYPIINFGDRIPNLLTAILGEGVFFCPSIYAIKLMDIEFPDSYLEQFPGPKFGIKGLRAWTGIKDRPLFMGVIKPNIGLDPQAFGDLAYQSWLGGLDIAKDDEMLCDTTWSPFAERTKVLGRARADAEQRTGKRCCYLANITDEVDRLLLMHDIAVRNGADMLMLNAMCVGLSAVRMVRNHTQVPLVAHFDMIAPFSRVPGFGVSSVVVTKLQRLVGFDAIIGIGLGSRMKSTPEEVLSNTRACTDPMGAIQSALPVPAGSQWAGSLKPLHDMIGNTDFAIVPGRAVFNHPAGPKAGAIALQQGWDAIKAGVSMEAYALSHEELRQSIGDILG